MKNQSLASVPALVRMTALSAVLFAAPVFASGGGAKPAEADKAAAAPTGKEYILTEGYTHHWLELPTVIGKKLEDGEEGRIKPAKGQPTVLIFLASWCLPCQKLTGTFEKLRTKYTPRNTRFVYVFAHDTRADAIAFAKDHKLKGEKILASQETLKAFHEPTLPTIYVGDRAGWLVERYVNVAPEGLKDLDGFLAKHTSF